MLTIRKVTDIRKAESVWRALSPQETVFDDWDFRCAFYKHEPYPLGFFVAEETSASGQKELVGLMPLQLHPQHGWEFFAEDPSEENRPFVRPGYEQIIPQLYAAIPAPAKCFDIAGEDDFTKNLPLEDYVYFLPLDDWADFNDYLRARLSSKKQRNFRSDLRKLEPFKPTVRWNEPSDLEEVFRLNTQKFADSYLGADHERAGWRGLLGAGLNCQIVSVNLAGAVKAASFSIVYKDTYFYLINGLETGVPGLGKYLNQVNIERAISLGAKFFDAGLGDCNWKEAWHFERRPQYNFIKPISEGVGNLGV